MADRSCAISALVSYGVREEWESRNGLKLPGQSGFIECFTTTFLRAHSWLNWVQDRVGI